MNDKKLEISQLKMKMLALIISGESPLSNKVKEVTEQIRKLEPSFGEKNI